MTAAPHVYPSPAVNVEIKPYFDAADENKLLIKQCQDCGETHFYPRALCPYCFSDNTEWLESSGKGVIYSYSVMRITDPSYAIAYVQLEEGVTMLTHIVGCDYDALEVGQTVEVIFTASKEGQAIPVFKPTVPRAAGQ